MKLKNWLQLSLINLLIVAFLGVVLRYKIAFSLPLIDQKNLLHGHSHFAFSGWITQALMALVVHRLSAYSNKVNFKRYNWLLWANALCAYGMLVSFPAQGYGLFSIVFSTLELFVSYIFMGYVWKDISHANQKGIILNWFKAGSFFNALSSGGAWSLAIMMATKHMHQHLYLGSVYFFLHFQYNGWFLFTVLGLLFEKLEASRLMFQSLRPLFWIFALACIPAYFLSALWMPIPTFAYILVVAAAIAQMTGWVWTLKLIIRKRKFLKQHITNVPFKIITLSFIALTIKFTLQLGSTIPSLSTLAFGFRPIVIGYLHLVLLGVISLFIIGYTMHLGIIENNARIKAGIGIFISGIILNEAILMIQGFAAMGYIAIPYINEALFCIATLMFSGLFIMNIPPKKRDRPIDTPYRNGLMQTNAT